MYHFLDTAIGRYFFRPSYVLLFFLAQEYVGQTLLQEAVRNHGRVDLMEKRNGEKLAASWCSNNLIGGKTSVLNIRGQHGIPSQKMNMSW